MDQLVLLNGMEVPVRLQARVVSLAEAAAMVASLVEAAAMAEAMAGRAVDAASLEEDAVPPHLHLHIPMMIMDGSGMDTVKTMRIKHGLAY